jgi:oligoendopeptidase F
MAQAVARREELDQQFTWDVDSVFASEAEFEAAIQRTEELLPKIRLFQGTVAQGPERLAELMKAVEAGMLEVGKIYVYASMLHDADTANQAAAAKNDRALTVYSQFVAVTSFIDPELLSIDAQTLRNWLREEPRLHNMAHYIDKLEKRRPHVRSTEVEEVLGLATNPFQSARRTHGVLADADLAFEPAVTSTGDRIEISQGNIDALLSDTDRNIRQSAWENYADAHLTFKNTMASCLSVAMKEDAFQARVRKYDSTLDAALAPNFIPQSVFYNLLDTFKRNLPTWHRYWNLRKRTLGYDELHEYDIKVPLSQDPPRISYEQSIKWILEGMAPLGAEYVQAMERGLRTDRWVDVYPNQGKRAGAYSGGWYNTHPFILMSYTDDIFSLSTLAHELGHSMHTLLANRSQPLINADYSIFAAEVASNFNQSLVRRYMLKDNTDVNFQIALIDEAMSNFHRYFFIMPTLARLELEMHERAERNEPLTAQILIDLMADLFQEGYGNEVVMDRDRIGITWGEFPTHLYMNFYVFQYATGISAAHALANQVLEHGEPAADKYLSFLRSGGSMYPLDALKMAGVDMTSREPVEEAFGFLTELVDRLDRLVSSQG